MMATEDATYAVVKRKFFRISFIAAYKINVSWIINCDGLLYIVHAHYFFY